MNTIETLKSKGADIATGLARCANNEALYLKLVGMGLGDQKFEELGTVLAQNDLDRAFEICHALKGVIGNLALSPLFESLSRLTEVLRARESADYPSLYGEMMSVRATFLDH